MTLYNIYCYLHSNYSKFIHTAVKISKIIIDNLVFKHLKLKCLCLIDNLEYYLTNYFE